MEQFGCTPQELLDRVTPYELDEIMAEFNLQAQEEEQRQRAAGKGRRR